jgi:hypothetical protein
MGFRSGVSVGTAESNASHSSPISQTWSVMPAAMAGVTRSVRTTWQRL